VKTLQPCCGRNGDAVLGSLLRILRSRHSRIHAHHRRSEELIQRPGLEIITSQVAVLRVAFQQFLALEEAADAPCEGLSKPGQIGAGRRFHAAEPQPAIGVLDIPPSRNSMWKWPLRLGALPKHWISVTAPACAVLCENSAFLIRCVAMQR
jgi:hypothetical protein